MLLDMTFVPEPDIAQLNSLREVISWAIGAHAAHDVLNEVSRSVRNRSGRYELAHNGRKNTIDYGGCPGHEHAYWFLRMGLMNVSTVERVQARTKRHEYDCTCGCHDALDRRTRNRNRPCTFPEPCFRKWDRLFAQGHKAFDLFVPETAYGIDALCRGAQVPDDVRDWIVKVVQPDPGYRQQGRRDQKTDQLPFDPERVRTAIDATRAGLVAPTRAATAPDQETLPRPGPWSFPLRIVHRGHALSPGLEGGRPRLVRGRAADVPEVVVGPDGTIIAHRGAGGIYFAGVDPMRVTFDDWRTPVPLSALPEGSLLAVDRAERDDAAFVWAAPGFGTRRYRVTRDSTTPALVSVLALECAAAAVMNLDRTLLAFSGDSSPYLLCEALPGLNLVAMVAATGDGQSAVLATGRGTDGQIQTWVERNGVTRLSAEGAVFLQLGLGQARPPDVVDDDGRAVPLTAEQKAGQRYEHWISAAVTQRSGEPRVSSADNHKSVRGPDASRGESGRA